MKNFIFFVFFVLNTSLLFAQSNLLTDRHISIKGTRFAIIPPSADFVIKTSPYTGLENIRNNAKIQIVLLDTNDSDYQRYRNNLTSFMQNGKTKISEEEITMPVNINAIYKIVRGMQKKNIGEGVGEMAEFIVHELSFKIDNEEIYVYASYLAKDDTNLGKQIESALRSFIYQKDKKISVLDRLDFNIDPSATKLKPNNVTPTMIELNVSGTPNGGDEPFYTVTQFDATPDNIAALGDGNFILNERLSSSTVTDKKLQLFENRFFKGYEVTAFDRETLEDDRRLIYIVILRNDHKIYSIKGEALYDYEGFLAAFRKITETISE